METHQLTPASGHKGHLDTQFLRRHSTKVVIQEIPTGRYWNGSGFWTSAMDKAKTLHSCSAAMEEVAHLKLKNVQLVLTRELQECEIFPLQISIRS